MTGGFGGRFRRRLEQDNEVKDDLNNTASDDKQKSKYDKFSQNSKDKHSRR